jgi:rhamnulokinase
LAGPVEAAAVGNILVQAFSSGLLKNHEEMRRISRLSFQLKHYEPRKVNEWNTAYERFLEILEKNHLIGEKIDRF